MMDILQADPFPPTGILEAEAMVFVAFLFIHFLIIFVLIGLMLYLRKFDDYIPILITYLFSLVIGMISFEHSHPPFSPYFEIFFLIFQTGLFITYVLKFYEIKIKR